jgi:UDP-N-acetyl-D-mannosaminuronate dehydrogenase
MIAAANEGYPRDTIPRPSPGVGGYCLTKDPFLYASKDNSLAHSKLARLGREVNNQVTSYPLDILHRFACITELKITKLKILIIGMAFKGVPATNDLRGSTSVTIAREMMALGCNVYCYDAVVTSAELSSIGLSLVSLDQCLPNVDAVFILNNHPDNVINNFLSLLKFDSSVLIFDGWNLLDRFEVEKKPNMIYANLGYMTKKLLNN